MSKTLPGLTPWPADQPLPAGAIMIFYDPATNDEYGVHPARLGGEPPAPAVPPASYSDTLSGGNTQVEGITASLTGPQTLRVNPLSGVSGANLVLQLLDSSDNNRLCEFGFLSGYAGSFYKFQQKNGSFYEALFSASDQTITV